MDDSDIYVNANLYIHILNDNILKNQIKMHKFGIKMIKENSRNKIHAYGAKECF
jgi:hypothetical protein